VDGYRTTPRGTIQVLAKRQPPYENVLVGYTERVAKRPAAQIQAPAKLPRRINSVTRGRAGHRGKRTPTPARQRTLQLPGKLNIIAYAPLEDPKPNLSRSAQRRRGGTKEDTTHIHLWLRNGIAAEEAIQVGAIQARQSGCGRKRHRPAVGLVVAQNHTTDRQSLRGGLLGESSTFTSTTQRIPDRDHRLRYN
jgi:hypothetical protein